MDEIDMLQQEIAELKKSGEELENELESCHREIRRLRQVIREMSSEQDSEVQEKQI